MTQPEYTDVLIVGAGLSGIAAAYYLQTQCPTKRYTILEGRDTIGGTWDLFRYPGVRSDSDMHTLGYSFRPWQAAKAIAGGSSILAYIRETAHAFAIDKQIRFQHRVLRASWSSAEARWTVEAEVGADKQLVRFSCRFLFLCSGYYDYANGYTPAWPGMEQFAGPIIHPQHWPDNITYAGKNVVVIGSGATAVTLVPAMVEQATHVTMVQRSPTYIVAQPSQDTLNTWLKHLLPAHVAHRIARWRSLLLGMAFYGFVRWQPAFAKRTLVGLVRSYFGPDYDVDRHFSPRYNPWDQRLCLVPDADLFAAIKSGRASVVTDQIERFTETGIRLCSGGELAADLVVAATGLTLTLMSGMQLCVDGVPIELSQTLSYKGMMYSGIPNLASAVGYTNASWTLKCELISAYVCRLLNYMDRHGYVQSTPQPNESAVAGLPVLNLTSGYVQRALETLPRQGSRRPWKNDQNYLLDVFNFKFARLNDGAMKFRKR